MAKEWDTYFKQAEATLKKIETLLAWRELELGEERPGCDTMKLLHHSTADDLKTEVGVFVNLFFALSDHLRVRSQCICASRTRRLQALWGRFRGFELRLAKAL